MSIFNLGPLKRRSTKRVAFDNWVARNGLDGLDVHHVHYTTMLWLAFSLAWGEATKRQKQRYQRRYKRRLRKKL